MLLERAGRRVKLVPGSCRNLKITTPEDRELAEFYLKKEPTEWMLRDQGPGFSAADG
ncbi:MAG: 2-C-methyl-D-erythritol 4-phosphate cytidylyltransferase [Angelakisella sp.]